MKLIDADVFESVLDFADSDVCEESPDGHCDFGFSRENIRELLRDIPAVEAVPVVRCRECKHRSTEDCPMYFHSSYWHEGYEEYVDDDTDHTEDDYFCQEGERKEGADNET